MSAPAATLNSGGKPVISKTTASEKTPSEPSASKNISGDHSSGKHMNQLPSETEVFPQSKPLPVLDDLPEAQSHSGHFASPQEALKFIFEAPKISAVSGKTKKGCYWFEFSDHPDWQSAICKRHVTAIEIMADKLVPAEGCMNKWSMHFVLAEEAGDSRAVIHLDISPTDTRHEFQGETLFNRGKTNVGFMARFTFSTMTTSQHNKSRSDALASYTIPTAGSFGDMLVVLWLARPPRRPSSVPGCDSPIIRLYYVLDPQKQGCQQWILDAVEAFARASLSQDALLFKLDTRQSITCWDAHTLDRLLRDLLGQLYVAPPPTQPSVANSDTKPAKAGVKITTEKFSSQPNDISAKIAAVLALMHCMAVDLEMKYQPRPIGSSNTEVRFSGV
ncbi:hypothetical protein B0T24DRAFT_587334 [Lasiosphaeria ovina]|uniref:Uncharacterized protein n=1 Tax=Lasiosphaeria ovina TaxID=92902 RepID=A0AAE0NJC4_9PEZI|nr:hypothetical protein B0T24DRAFT_587334 [Lasiosphaeria ovina]